jgi:hypothetical protein
MAQLTLTVDNAQVPRILAAFASRAGKDVADMDAEDVREVLMRLVVKIVRQYEKDEAEKAISVTDVDVS